VSLASGGLAVSEVHDRERRAAEQLGPSVAVVVATRDLRAGATVTRDAVGVRQVPARYAPVDALVTTAGIFGARLAVPVAANGYLSAGSFAGNVERHGDRARKGERVVTVEVAGGTALATVAAGTRVDVLVSTESGAGGGRTVMALAGAELLDVAAPSVPRAPADAAGFDGPAALATLRVTVRQAIYLTAADNFAREIRVLARPPGDRAAAGGAVSQAQL
jgi:pilus assembly protein CpaB